MGGHGLWGLGRRWCRECEGQPRAVTGRALTVGSALLPCKDSSGGVSGWSFQRIKEGMGHEEIKLIKNTVGEEWQGKGKTE